MTDDQLMQACRTGSADAFGEIFDRHRSAVWGFFRRRITDRARAEDLMQDTFVALLKSTGRYDARDAFRSFLFGIAYNVLSEHRRTARHAPGDDGLIASVPAQTADLAEVLTVRRAIAELDAIDRDVLLLREFESLAYAEIADALGIPLNTVRSRLFRARMALKEKLQ